MRVSGIVVEDFVNYKKPSLFIGSVSCDFKCCKEGGFPPSVCQNHDLFGSAYNIDDKRLYQLYQSNDITEAVVIGGLEPMLQIDEVVALLRTFRDNGCMDTFIIYTGYYEHEVNDQVRRLSQYPNVIIKFGRYIPTMCPRFDDTLGVDLASGNQYAKKIS